MTLSSPTGGATLGSQTTAVLTIIENDQAQRGVLAFSSPTYSVGEGDGVASITVARTSGSDGAVTVILTPSAGTATVTSDFDATPITVTFANGQTSQTVTIPIVDDIIFEGDETVNLTLSSPTGGATLGSQTTAVLTIIENDQQSNPGTLMFSSPTYFVSESGIPQTPIEVIRVGGSSGAVSVTVVPTAGTATPTSDFDSTTVTVNFANGEISKIIDIPIVDDLISEPDETINLTLSNPTNGATLGQPNTATAILTITDDDISFFISQWKTDNTSTGSSANNQVRLPLLSSGGTYNFTVNWGDNSTDTITSGTQPEITHTYASIGTYTIVINGTIEGWRFGNTGDRLKFLNVSSWGVLRLGNGGNYFQGCANFTLTATTPLDLTGTTILTNMFTGCNVFNGNINNWNVSNVTAMNNMFSCPGFNQPLNNWNVSNVTNMSGMFAQSFAFNQPLNDWNVSNVTDMSAMFRTTFGSPAFNQPLNNWNVSKVTNMTQMFDRALSFNQDLSSWCVTLILTAPAGFDNNTPAWQGKPGTLPQWGTCPSP